MGELKIAGLVAIGLIAGFLLCDFYLRLRTAETLMAEKAWREFIPPKDCRVKQISSKGPSLAILCDDGRLSLFPG